MAEQNQGVTLPQPEALSTGLAEHKGLSYRSNSFEESALDHLRIGKLPLSFLAPIVGSLANPRRQLAILSMHPGVIYNDTELSNSVNTAQGIYSSPKESQRAHEAGWKIRRRVLEKNFENMEDAGCVAHAITNPQTGGKIGFLLTRLGDYGQIVAGSLMDYNLKYPDIALSNFLGEKVTIPRTQGDVLLNSTLIRLAVLHTIATHPDDEILALEQVIAESSALLGVTRLRDSNVRIALTGLHADKVLTFEEKGKGKKSVTTYTLQKSDEEAGDALPGGGNQVIWRKLRESWSLGKSFSREELRSLLNNTDDIPRVTDAVFRHFFDNAVNAGILTRGEFGTASGVSSTISLNQDIAPALFEFLNLTERLRQPNSDLSSVANNIKTLIRQNNPEFQDKISKICEKAALESSAKRRYEVDSFKIVIDWLRSHPDITIRDLHETLAEEGFSLSANTVGHYLLKALENGEITRRTDEHNMLRYTALPAPEQDQEEPK